MHASVGGRADNEVGFLWLAEDAPPPMAPDEFIRIEPVADGWWLFRTT